MSKSNQTISIEDSVKRDFKAEVAMNGSDMSSTLEHLMMGYIKSSRKIREERNGQKDPNQLEIK